MPSPASLLALVTLGASLTAFCSGPSALAAGETRAKVKEGVVKGAPGSLLQVVKRGDRDAAGRLLRTPAAPASADSAATDVKGEAVPGPAARAGETSIVGAGPARAGDPNTEAERADAGRVPAEAAVSEAALDSEGAPLNLQPTAGGAEWLVERLLEGGLRSAPAERDPAREVRPEVAGPGSGDGVNLDAVDARGESALHEALSPGHPKSLPLPLGHGASPTLHNAKGGKPLHLALQSGDIKAVDLLLGRGADPDAKGARGRTAMGLVLALEAPAEHLEALLVAGADANATGLDGRAPIDVVLTRHDFASAQLLLAHGADPGAALYNAVVENDGETFSFLLKNKVDPNGSSNDPPLVAAVRNGNAEMVARLLAAGAAHGSKGREGQSALHLAVAMDRADLAKLLLEAGADPSVPFAEPYSAAFLSKVREIGYAKWQFRKDRRIYPLMVAADSGNLELARTLLDHGARKNVWTGRKAYYPVGFAARRDDVKMMQLLLDRDPDHEEQWIKVDLSAQRAWVYGVNGATLLSTKISSGKKGYRTETGEFVITNKTRHHVSTIYKSAKMPYFQRLSCGDFGFHEGYCPGYAASHGCIRIPRGNAYKFWKLTRTGDRVVIVP